MNVENIPEWIAALCALLASILGILGKIIWGLRCYDRRVDKLESDQKHQNERHISSIKALEEDLTHERRRRDQIDQKLDNIEQLISKAVSEMSYLRGQFSACPHHPNSPSSSERT